MKTINKSVLLRTSAATDVLNSNGNLAITGLRTVPKKYITNLVQVKYRAEVAQVVTVGASAYTPTASTTYKVLIGDSNRVDSAYQESLKAYSYTTSATLAIEGATAALRREYIHAQIVADINADASNHVVAASLGTGTGFTITDDGAYYPVYAQNMTNMKGVTQVVVATNDDGTGFASTDWSLTTAGVYSFGSGAILASMAPVVDAMFGGNLVSGVIDAPPLTTAGLSAVSGQNYDGFFIEALKEVVTFGGMVGQFAYVPELFTAYVDNGTGSATTNLAGFKAFERAFHQNVAEVLFSQDTNSVIEFFDKPLCIQGPLGAAPAGTANALGWILSPYGSLNHTNIGTQTIVAPVLDATGLLIDQDDTANDGAHYSANQQTIGVQEFIVGKQEFSVVGRIVFADILNSHFMIGFRKKAAYTADWNDYTDLASIGIRVSGALGAVATEGILNNAATVENVAGGVLVNAVSVQFIVKVAISGAVTCYVNGVNVPVYSAGTTALIFDADDVMIPFFQHVNINSANAGASISEFVAVAKKDWIVTAV